MKNILVLVGVCTVLYFGVCLFHKNVNVLDTGKLPAVSFKQ